MPLSNSVVPTAALAARTAPTAPPTAPPMPKPSAACDRVCRANSLDRVASDISTLMSSRLKPRFISASTADSAAILLLKSAVTNLALAIQSSPTNSSIETALATRVPHSSLRDLRNLGLRLFGFRTDADIQIEHTPDQFSFVFRRRRALCC